MLLFICYLYIIDIIDARFYWPAWQFRTLSYSAHVELYCCIFPNLALTPKHIHTKRSWSRRPIFSLVVQIKYSWPHWPDSFCWEKATGVTSDDKVHLWEVGIGVKKSGNCCPILLQQSTYSVSQEGSWCHKKSIKSTSNYPGNWQWNWKSLWPLRQPIPTSSTRRFLLCDSSTFAVVMKVLSQTPEWTHNVLMTLFARITFIVALYFCKFTSIDVLRRIQLFVESNSDLVVVIASSHHP